MTYLLDTCAVSDFVKGNPKTLDKIKLLSPADIAISSVTEMEIKFGLALNQKSAQKIQSMLMDFLSVVSIIPFGSKEADIAGKIRAELQRKGKPVGAYDLLIAGTAIAHDLKLVTSNLREFNQIRQLAVENWRG